jgi:hypothetical protein
MTKANSRFDLITDPINQGFTITFPNGYGLSVRWGAMSRCDLYFKYSEYDEPPAFSRTAEFAILDPKGELVGDPEQFATSADLIQWMQRAAAM